ncbi:hypothetical protein ACFL4T_11915 [candidate division KSB1 bacterium]
MKFKNKKGFTLFQLVMVIIGLGMAAAVAVRFMFYSTEEARKQKTLNEMKRIVYAIHGNPEIVPQTNFGYVGDMVGLPGSLSDLVNSVGGGLWNGPYYDIGFDEDPDDVLYDAWGQLYTYNPSSGYIISTGSGSDLRQNFLLNPSKLMSNSIQGTVKDNTFGIPVGKETSNFSMTLTHKGNSGTLTKTKWTQKKVDANGRFIFTDLPAGNYMLTVTYTSLNATINKFITLQPIGGTEKITIKFNIEFL